MNLDFVSFFQPVFLIKIVTLVIIIFYAIFAFVVHTQIKVMAQIVRLPHAETILKTISIINIALAVSLFLLALVIL